MPLLSRISRVLLLTLIVTSALVHNAVARRLIPDNNLAYPVLITLKNGASGSGFYLNTGSDLYLVTARHVLYEPNPDPNIRKLRDVQAGLLSYSKDISDPTPTLLEVDLLVLEKDGDLRPHASADVAVAKIGTIDSSDVSTEQRPLTVSFRSGVTMKSHAVNGLVGAQMDIVKKFDQVLTGNEVILFGYPNSLGLQPDAQFDSHRPLLRKGIVAAQNIQKRSIILDCPVYQGNSGGPVIQIEPDDANVFMTHFNIIGVVNEFIPFADVWLNVREGFYNKTLMNSGYSIASPMDVVLELVK